MRLVTYNIQSGLGVDGIVALDRIVRVVAETGPADVLCLQEVARNLPRFAEGDLADQPAAIAAAYPAYEAVFAAAVDLPDGKPGMRRQFGNMILSRYPVLQVFRHSLPRPPHPGVRHMQRGALEAVIDGPFGPFRLITTHLEFFAARQRKAQVEALRALHAEACANVREPPAEAPASGTYVAHPRPLDAILCGDFNMEPQDPEYARIQAPFDDGTPAFRDAWRIAYGDAPHAPTCGIFDRAQWPKGENVRDFFFAAGGIAARVKDVIVNVESNASDHQPVRLDLAD